MATPQTLDVRACDGDWNFPVPMLFDANYCVASSAGAAVSVTCAADTTKPNFVYAILYSYSAAPTGGRISISDGTNTLFDLDVTAAGPGNPITFPAPMSGGANKTLTITLAAPGGAIVGKLNVIAYKTA